MAGAAAIACSDPSTAPVEQRRTPPAGAIDLLQRLDEARRLRERSVTAPVPDRLEDAFGRNWRQLGGLGDCKPCALGVGERSELEVFVTRPRAIELHLRCGAYVLAEGHERFVDVRIGGQRIGSMRLQRDRRDFDLPVPAAALRRGANTVSFHYRGDLAPARQRGGEPDTPGTQMACGAMAWVGLPDADEPRRALAGNLLLPAGSAIDYSLDLERGARLWLRGVRAVGARLLVEITPLRGAPQTFEVDGAAPGADREYAIAGAGVHRLALYGIGEAGHVEVGGLYLAGVRPPAAAPPPIAGTPPGAGHPPVIVFLVDTLRRDRLGAYGYSRPTSPNLDAFADQAVLFERAVAQAPWTKPAVASLFTGLEPVAHGVNHLGGILPPAAETIAELLGAAGYQTAAFSGSEAITADAGFAQGFEVFEQFPGEPGGVGPDSPVVLERVRRWLATRADERPLFLYVHTVDPHAPYRPAAPYRARLAGSVDRESLRVDDLLPEALDDANALYDAEVAFADAGFGELLGLLRRHALFDDALVLFVADHGEQFLEHGGWRHRDLFGEVIDIPLVVKFPRGWAVAPRRVRERVSQIDLWPAIAGLVGRGTPPEQAGRDLFGVARAATGELGDRRIHGQVVRARRSGWSLIAPPYKLIWTRESTHQAFFLYDVEHDPREQRDLAPLLPVLREHLARTIRAERLGRTPVLRHGSARLDDDQTARLKALGYLD